MAVDLKMPKSVGLSLVSKDVLFDMRSRVLMSCKGLVSLKALMLESSGVLSGWWWRSHMPIFRVWLLKQGDRSLSIIMLVIHSLHERIYACRSLEYDSQE